MNLVTLLAGEGYAVKEFGDKSRIKVMRHASSGNVEKSQLFKIDLDFLEAYQASQKQNLCEGCDLILSFIEFGPRRALFRGAWKKSKEQLDVESYMKTYSMARRVKVLENDVDFDNWYFYRTARLTLLESMRDRLVIEFPQGQLFHRYLNENDFSVIEILPVNYVGDFGGYYDFVLSYVELKKLIASPSSNRVWHQYLSSVAGVYLILDTKSGKQYVGSAYGTQGIWGRWSEYARDPSGGNVMLQKLLDEHGLDYAHNFQYSIMRVIERAATKNQVIQAEKMEKLKLGTRAFGLTIN